MAAILADVANLNDAAGRGVKEMQDYANVARDGGHRGQIVLPKFLKNELEENLLTLAIDKHSKYEEHIIFILVNMY